MKRETTMNSFVTTLKLPTSRLPSSTRNAGTLNCCSKSWNKTFSSNISIPKRSTLPVDVVFGPFRPHLTYISHHRCPDGWNQNAPEKLSDAFIMTSGILYTFYSKKQAFFQITVNSNPEKGIEWAPFRLKFAEKKKIWKLMTTFRLCLLLRPPN